MEHKPWKILMVDDDEEDYLITRQMLEDAKGGRHILEWASSYEEGRRMLAEDTYDAVLMDYDLGAYNGLELTRRVVAQDYPAPIILFTGRGSYEVDREALQAGATLYLTKGETSALLLERSIRYAIEHKRTQDLLRSSEQRFRDLFEAMREAFFICEVLRDPTGRPVDIRYLEVNPATYTRARRTRDEMVGHTYLELFPPNPTFQFWLERFGQVAETGKPQHFEQYAEATDMYFDVDAYSPQPGQVAVLLNDVTGRRRAEHALRTSEQRWATTLASIGDAVIATDLQGNILFMNPVAEALTGWSLPEATLAKLAEVFHIVDEETHQRVENPVSKVLSNGKMVGLANHTLLIQRNGGEIPIDDSAAPIQDEDGEVFGVVLIFRDVSERRRASEQLRQSQQQLMDFIESTHDTFFAIDQEWRIRYANRRLGEMLNQDPGELIGQSYFEALPRYAGTEVEQRFRQVMESREPAHFTIDGRYTARWFDVSVYPIRNGIAVFGADRTDEHLANEALREREELLRLALSAGKTGVFHWNMKTNAMHWSDEYYQIFGMQPQSQPPSLEAWSASLHPRDRERMTAVVQQALAQGRPIDDIYRVTWPDGSLHWVHSISHTFYDDAGRPERMAGIAIDISEQKQAEQALQESERRYRELAETLEVERAKLSAAIETLPIGLGIGATDGTTLSMNAAGLDLHGFQSEAEMFSRLERYMQEFELCYLDRRVIPMDQWPATRATRGEFVQDFEVILHNKLNGQERIVSYSVVPVKNSRGETVLIMYVMQDMTGRKQAEQALQKSEERLKEQADRLERSNRDLEEFAYVASHDLQEPLRKIEAFSTALGESAENLDETQQDYLERMKNATQRMRRLVDNLLVLSRVDRAGQRFKLTDLGQVAQDVLSILEMQIRRTRGTVEVAPLPVIEADPVQMHQLLQNLISNALKFHRPDVPPHVRVFTGKQTPDRVALVVVDNGIGFPQSEVERIFQPFHRLHGRSEYEGAGIGLAICKKIVDRHGGRIDVQSTPGEGAIFTVTLPVQQH